MADHKPEYFALPDPLDPSKMSYWYRPTHRGIPSPWVDPWPPRRNPWGRLAYADVPFDKKTHPKEYRAFVNAHFANVDACRRSVDALIGADPNPLAARFAALTARCCCCGKRLSDERSKVYAIGPECRFGADPGWLASMVDATARAHAEALAASDA